MNTDTGNQKSKTKEIIFEEIIKYAANQDADRMEDDFPSEEDLQELIQPSEKFETSIQKMIHQQKRKHEMKAALRMTKKIAACFIITIVAFVTIAFSVEATRIKMINFITETKREYTNIRYNDGTNSDGGQSDLFKGWDQIYLPGYIPEGFVLNKTERLINTSIIEYTNNQGLLITFSYAPASGRAFSIDTEGAVIKELSILDNEALAVQKDNKGIQENKIIFHNNEISFLISSSYNMEELIEMGNSVRLISKSK